MITLTLLALAFAGALLLAIAAAWAFTIVWLYGALVLDAKALGYGYSNCLFYAAREFVRGWRTKHGYLIFEWSRNYHGFHVSVADRLDADVREYVPSPAIPRRWWIPLVFRGIIRSRRISSTDRRP